MRRGLGWYIHSEYSGPRGDLFYHKSYGYTGWTGTLLWIDPAARTFVVYLSNRNQSDGQGNVVELSHQLGSLATEVASAEKSCPGS